MTSPEPEVSESPATWANVLVGETKEAVGHLLNKPGAGQDGEAQKNVAYDLRKQWTEEHSD